MSAAQEDARSWLESEMKNAPFIHIEITSEGLPRVQTNLTHPGLMLGLMEHAKFVLLMNMTKPPSRVQPVNGGAATDRLLKD